MYVIKKKWVIVFAVVLAIGIAGAVTIGCVSGGSVTTAALSTIVIDAGHGGVDAGAVGVSGTVKESDLNLAVANALKAEFQAAGYRVIMTRADSDGLYGTASAGFKRRDMEKRRQIIADANPDLVLSIHMNTCNIRSRKGAQVFFLKGSEVSKPLADRIQQSLNDGLKSPRQYQALAGDYFMLKCSAAPAVIVECGFLSNPEEEQLLTQADYQEKLAHFVYSGAVGYLNA